MYLRCPEIARLVVVRTRPRQRSIMAKRKKEAKKAAIPQAKKKAKKAKKEGDSKSGGPPAMPTFRLDGNSGPHTLRFMESAKRHRALTAPHGKLTDAWAGVIRDLNAMGFAMSRKRGGELLQDCLDAHERRIALQDQSASPDVERVCAQLLSAKVADVKAKGETKAKRERDAKKKEAQKVRADQCRSLAMGATDLSRRSAAARKPRTLRPVEGRPAATDPTDPDPESVRGH